VAVQNRVGEAMYGYYFSLFNFAFILNILLDLGITNYNNRSIARDHSRLGPYLESIIPIKFMLSILYAVIVFATGAIIGYSELQFRLLAILVINQFLSSFILYLRSNISGIQLFRTDSLLSMLDRTLMILINSVLLWTNFTSSPYRIEWFVYSQTISYTITLLIVFLILMRHSGRLQLKFRLHEVLPVLRRSYPFAILILLMSFFNRADSVIIERLLPDGKEQAGIYAQSFRVLDAFSQFAVLFSALLLPMFSKMLKTGEKTGGLIRISASLLLAVSISVAIAGIFFNEEIIELMYHEVRANSAQIFSILMTGFVFISISYIYGTLLTANRNLKQLNIIAAITVLLNLSLNFLLIPEMKTTGAAIASLSSQAFYAVGQIVIAHRKIKPDIEVKMYLRMILFIILISVSAYIFNQFFEWVPAFLLFAAMCILLSIVTGIIRPGEILSIFREE